MDDFAKVTAEVAVLMLDVLTLRKQVERLLQGRCACGRMVVTAPERFETTGRTQTGGMSKVSHSIGSCVVDDFAAS